MAKSRNQKDTFWESEFTIHPDLQTKKSFRLGTSVSGARRMEKIACFVGVRDRKFKRHPVINTHNDVS